MARDIRPFVSSMSGDVFCVHSLPVEIIASLLAKYSRSNKPLREEMASYLDEAQPDAGVPATFDLASEKASKFHKLYTTGFGHKSIADAAHVSVAIENCSMIAAKAIQDARLGAYIEKSTRYVPIDPSQDPPMDRWGVPVALRPQVRALFQMQLHNYEAMTRRTKERLVTKFRKEDYPNGDVPLTDAQWDRLTSAKAFDMCRGLLPFGSKTSLGMTMSASNLAHTLQKWSESELHEMQALAHEVRTQASKVVPTLLKYSEGTGYYRDLKARVGAVAARAEEGEVIALGKVFDPKKGEGRTLVVGNASVKSLRCSYNDYHSDFEQSDFEQAFAQAILGELELPPRGNLSHPDNRAICEAYLEKHTLHQQPGRALEHFDFQCTARLDIGAWRDLQRHRMMTQYMPDFRSGTGFYNPFLSDVLLSGEEDLRNLYEVAAISAYTALYANNKQLYTQVWTPYLLPLCTMIEWSFKANLRQLVYVVERRSVPEGHPSYRQVAREIGRRLTVEDSPFNVLKDSLKLDDGDYPFARQATVTKSA